MHLGLNPPRWTVTAHRVSCHGVSSHHGRSAPSKHILQGFVNRSLSAFCQMSVPRLGYGFQIFQLVLKKQVPPFDPASSATLRRLCKQVAPHRIHPYRLKGLHLASSTRGSNSYARSPCRSSSPLGAPGAEIATTLSAYGIGFDDTSRDRSLSFAGSTPRAGRSSRRETMVDGAEVYPVVTLTRRYGQAGHSGGFKGGMFFFHAGPGPTGQPVPIHTHRPRSEGAEAAHPRARPSPQARCSSPCNCSHC